MAVVITNQISSAPDSFLVDSSVPIGGNVLAHSSKHRVYLKSHGLYASAKIVSSPCFPISNTRFTINTLGIFDTK